MAINDKKYLDLEGLQTFWNRVKEVILHSIVIVREGVAGTNNTGVAQNNTYIKIYTDDSNQTEDGGQKFIYTVDESPLVEKLSTVDAAIATEEMARKGDVANLAGKNWDTSSHTWSTMPEYSNITEISERLVTHNNQILALVQATEFVGVVTWNPAEATVEKTTDNSDGNFDIFTVTVTTKDGQTITTTFRSGDIIIYNNKEYILNGDINNNGENPEFVELGDVTEEMARLEAIETWINTSFISGEDLDNVFNPKSESV